ncbi:MAG: recombination regulator RecX [Actinobacteria bacterium]|nr:recombination regulator RecX [Actinomycetota bacterium]
MPKITGLRERRGRARVFVDGEFWTELDAGVAAKLGIREGAAFSHEDLAEARVAGERPLAMNRALNVLGYRARSRGELSERLARVGYAEETVETVVARLEELGYLDDEGFARELVRSGARKYGPRRIYGDLKRAGVDEEVARNTVEEEFAERSEHEAARAAARRRYNTNQGSEAHARRIYGFLMRRGYSAGICAEVAREYRRETDK